MEVIGEGPLSAWSSAKEMGRMLNPGPNLTMNSIQQYANKNVPYCSGQANALVSKSTG